MNYYGIKSFQKYSSVDNIQIFGAHLDLTSLSDILKTSLITKEPDEEDDVYHGKSVSYSTPAGSSTIPRQPDRGSIRFEYAQQNDRRHHSDRYGQWDRWGMLAARGGHLREHRHSFRQRGG